MNPRQAIATACGVALFSSRLAGCGSDDGNAPETGNERALLPANFFDDFNQAFNLAGGNTGGATWTATQVVPLSAAFGN